MLDFEYRIPTKFYFGKDQENRLGEVLKEHGATKVLLVLDGGDYLEKTGLLGRLHDSLDAAGMPYVEIGGVQPNPKISLIRKAVELARAENVDFVVGVGGGSAIDSAKCTACGFYYDGDLWDLCDYNNPTEPQKALPIGCVPTVAATGTESSEAAVISNDEIDNKMGISSELARPTFAILNPELTYTVPPFQTGAGTFDMFTHALERYYFVDTEDVEIGDALGEAIMRTIVKFGYKVMENPRDYNARAQLMWCSVIAHNDSTALGRECKWVAHTLQEPLGALYDSCHGAGLAVLTPAWMRLVYKRPVNLPRFVKLAVSVFGVEPDPLHPEEVALEGIKRMEQWAAALRMPKNLTELGVREQDIETLADMCADRSMFSADGLPREDAIATYRSAL